MTEPSFLPFPYPRPKQHPTLLMRKIPSHLCFPFPTSDISLNKTLTYGRPELCVNHTPTEAHGAPPSFNPGLVHKEATTISYSTQ